MIRSLYSGISGLKNHQTKMDVIGDNIANVNTTGFKRSRVTFSTMLSQTLQGAGSPIEDSLGGTNPIQVGLGVSLGSIDRIMTQGSVQSTGNPTDMMITGPGFFMLSADGTDTDVVYSRAGAFSLDADGALIDPGSGYHVLDSEGLKIVIEPDEYAKFSVDSQGIITKFPKDGSDPDPDTELRVAIVNFPNEAGLTSLGGNFYERSNNSGEPSDFGEPYPAGTKLVSNSVEMSNVDLSTEFTDMIVTQRGFQANSRVITVSDTLLEELINLKR